MDTMTLVIVGLIAVLLIIALIAMAGRARREHRPSTVPLTPEARDRYAGSWDRLESRFIEAPSDAVQEADALVLAMLGEVRHPLTDERLPHDMKRARREARSGKTEGLRMAMLHYRAVLEDMAGSEKDRERRREMA